MAIHHFFSNACVFIDNSNLLNVLKDNTGNIKGETPGVVVDYSKLHRVIEKGLAEVFDRKISIQAVYLYDGIPTNHDEKAEKKRAFVASVEKKIVGRGSAFFPELYPIEIGRGRIVKGVDTKVALEIATLVSFREMDIAVIVSGDRDFIPVIKKAVAEFRVPIGIAFFEEAGLSRDLKKEASFFIPMNWETIAIR